MRKNEKRGGKRGASKAKLIIPIIIFILIALIIGSFVIHQSCKISQKEIDVCNNPGTAWSSDSETQEVSWFDIYLKTFHCFSYWFKENVFMCEQERTGIISNVAGFFSSVLGFDQNIYDFGIDLLTGLLVGLWVTGIFWLANLEKLFMFGNFLGKIFSAGYQANLKNSWLGFLGDNWWKIIPIGVFYAVIMQIPVITTIISVITFEPLLTFKSAWGWFLKSFIVAFYLGLVPTMIEQYTKFLLRKRLYTAIELEKARVAIENIRVRGK